MKKLMIALLLVSGSASAQMFVSPLEAKRFLRNQQEQTEIMRQQYINEQAEAFNSRQRRQFEEQDRLNQQRDIRTRRWINSNNRFNNDLLNGRATLLDNQRYHDDDDD